MDNLITKIKFEFDGDETLPLKHKFYSMEFNNKSDYMECKTNITDYMVDGTPREYISIVNDEDRETILNYMKNEDILNLEGNRINPEEDDSCFLFAIEIIFNDETIKNIRFDDLFSAPSVIQMLYKTIKNINNKYEKDYAEKILIQLAIYAIISTSNDEFQNLKDCYYILEKELEFSNEGKTIFEFKEKPEHIVNTLRDNLKVINEEKYREYINSAMLKLNYYYATIPGYHLMDLASERDVDELAYEIIYFNKGTDELKKESKANICAMNELCERYYYSNLYNEAFNLANEISLKGHKKAIYTKILCTYLGNGTQKNEVEAFNELTKYVNEHVYFKARELLGEMYYFGNGTQQNYKKAFECFKEADGILASAEYYLGLMYINGQGVEVDEKKGLDYIIGAAKVRYKKAIEYIIDNAYKKEKNESLSLDDLFNEGESKNITSEDDSEWQEYAEEFFEKFGRYPTIPEPDGTEKESIEAIKQCLEKGEDIYDKIIFEGRYDFEGSEDAVF